MFYLPANYAHDMPSYDVLLILLSFVCIPTSEYAARLQVKCKNDLESLAAYVLMTFICHILVLYNAGCISFCPHGSSHLTIHKS